MEEAFRIVRIKEAEFHLAKEALEIANLRARQAWVAYVHREDKPHDGT